MVNLEPKSASVSLGDLSQQFDDILGGASSGPNTDDRGNNNNDGGIGVHSDERVSSGQTRLSSIIIGSNEENDTGDSRVINDISSIRSDVFGNIHQEHVVDGRSSSGAEAAAAVYQGLNVTGEQSLSRHHQEIIHGTSISSPRTSSGLEIRAN